MTNSTYKFDSFETTVQYDDSEVAMTMMFPDNSMEIVDISAGLLSKLQNEEVGCERLESTSIIRTPGRNIYVVSNSSLSVALHYTGNQSPEMGLSDLFHTYLRIKSELPPVDFEGFEKAFREDFDLVFTDGQPLEPSARIKLEKRLSAIDLRLTVACHEDHPNMTKIKKLMREQIYTIDQLNQS